MVRTPEALCFFIVIITFLIFVCPIHFLVGEHKYCTIKVAWIKSSRLAFQGINSLFSIQILVCLLLLLCDKSENIHKEFFI